MLSKRVYWAAAAIVLLLSIGYFGLRNTQEGTEDVAVTPQHNAQKKEQPALQQDMINVAMDTKASPSAFQRSAVNVAFKEQKQNAPKEDNVSADSAVVANVPGQEKRQTQPAEQKQVLPKHNDMPLFNDNRNQYASNPAPKMAFGFSAFYGFSGIAKAQYRVSVDAKRNLSKKLFANVQLVASTARLSTSNSYQYQVISIGAAGAAPTTSTQETQATYSGNVYNLGLTPSIGIRLTKSVSVSAGPDIQKSLTGSVMLTNKDDFRNQINNQTLIDEQQEVAGLDIGIQSAAQVNVSSHFAFNLFYRYGFTDYLKKSNSSLRNSFICVGLSYNFK